MILHAVDVDDRERNPSAAERVVQLTEQGVPSRVRRLPDNGGGDFRWVVEPELSGQTPFAVSMERKTTNDLLSSVGDGRLSSFVTREGSPSELRALLVEHGSQSSHGRDWNDNQIDNLLCSIQACGVMVVHSPSAEATPERIKAFYLWTGRNEHQTFNKPALPSTGRVYFNPAERDAVRNLMTIPGWGENVAFNVLRHFGGSLSEVYTALQSGDYSRFREVGGVGPSRVEAAVNFIAGR